MRYQVIRHIILAAMLLLNQGAMAQEETIATADSTAHVLPSEPIITSKIRLLTRSYGDRVVLRWLPEDYVSWKFLRYYGVNILRVKKGTLDIDTLAHALKPMSRKQMEAKYPTTDQQAMIAMGMLYGEGRLGPNQTQEKPGSMGANMEYNNEQDLSFAYAMLVAEWRPDLAEAMAVGFTDRTAKKGETYDYYVQVTQWELDGKIIFEPGVNEGVEVTAFKPEPYDPQLMDTLSAPRRVALSWIDTEHSSYEIERREKGQKTWQRLNDRPYVSMVDVEDVSGLCVFSDSVSHNGTWEYRIMAHDAFGDLTPPSNVHVAYVRDIEAPKAPQLTRIVIERPDDNDPSARVLAHVHWKVSDSLEDDLKGYIIHYYNENATGHRWLPLTDEMSLPKDTVATIDMTGKRTGMLCIIAYDDSGNESQSLPQVIRLTDMQAPSAPDSLHATVILEGYVILSWRPKTDDDDIRFYDIAFANDSTHEFLLRNQGGISDPMYVDTLALDVNQKYVYYKVRATDYDGNVGQWSPALCVKRPHNTPPTVPHIDTSSHDDLGMHMRWVVGMDADMDYHLLKRRLGTDGEWQVLSRWDADSIARIGEYTVAVDDNPPYHRTKRYFYMVESYNSSRFSSQSLSISWLHEGTRFLDIPIRLFGDYLSKEKVVKLVWEIGQLPTKDITSYLCVFRKRAVDKSFRYLYNLKVGEMEFTDRSLLPGEEAQYYVLLRFTDGRESQESNVVTVKRKEE